MAPSRTALPDYSKKQEFWNSFSHALGVLFALIGGPFLIAKAVYASDGIKVTCAVIFTLSLFFLCFGFYLNQFNFAIRFFKNNISSLMLLIIEILFILLVK